MAVVITTSMPPSTNHLFAGAGKRRWRSSEYEAWITEAGYELNRQHPVSVAGKVSLRIEVQEPTGKRTFDLSNRCKAIEDLLVSHRIIEGDDSRYVRRIILDWSVDIIGVRITIDPIE